MALSKGSKPATPVPLPTPEANAAPKEPTQAAQNPAAEPDKMQAIENALLLAAKKPIRDPYSGIHYGRNQPMPLGDEGWCESQLAAGVLIVAPPPAEDEG